MRKYRNIGQSVEKTDAMALATGSSLFTEDYRLDNYLKVRILRSPHAHARIKSIDVSEAKEMEGVVDVISHKKSKKSIILQPDRVPPNHLLMIRFYLMMWFDMLVTLWQWWLRKPWR